MTSAIPKPHNWAGNVVFRASGLSRPSSAEELQRLVAASACVRALGTGHSFSPVADTTGLLISVAGLPPLIEPDTTAGTVTVAAGLRYSDIAPVLNNLGLALPNLASLPHLSVAGAVATGTHGSGNRNGSLATSVVGLELVTASGELITVRRAGRSMGGDFAGMVVALGTLGVVTAITLRTLPAFTVRQYVYEGIGFEAALGHLDEITGAGYSVSMFTGWQARAFTQTWVKLADAAASPPADSWLGGALAVDDLHPVPGMPAANCTPQRGSPGPWHERLPHFRPEFTPSAGAELQTEYLVNRPAAAGVLAALADISDQLAPVTQVSEVRTVAADELWLSPAYERDSVAFHFTWVPDLAAVSPVLAAVEAIMAPAAGRPHWGKIHAARPERVAALYPRLDDFGALARQLDPARKFGNEMVDSLLSA
ncbi:MAG TPA: FAD-binding protein [Streptosporangiaceae bacterium]